LHVTAELMTETVRKFNLNQMILKPKK
jgi:hypothetical protein